jgi:Fe-S-cluster-containing dehydrogenase component
MSLSTAQNFDLKNGDMVELSVDDNKLELPIWILPGHADDSISLTLGYGRENAGRIGDGVGFNAYKLRTTKNQYIGNGVSLRKTGQSHDFATTQDHGSMEGRPLVREANLDEYRKHPDFATEMVEHPPLKSLWKEHEYTEGYQWGMSIDLNVCTGCNACTVACQSENNIPIVGKEQVAMGREMHWIRLDRYFAGDIDEPEVVYQPVGCQQCEMAPCEQVCPVAATVHDKEGLNAMIYNRCVGTRYCANNCPYKVRRFNFLNFTKDTPEIVKMAQNPDVSVRSRGVMEKCTYCVQRISEAKINSKAEGRLVDDNDLKTACQQSCPTMAIVFGDINNPESEVSKIKKQNRNYSMLGEFNTRPRTTFLAKLRNPNPKLAKPVKKDSHS